MRMLAFLFGLLFLFDPATTRLFAAENHVQVELLADVETIVPGQPFHLGASLQIEKEWHVYWRTPGTGQPTTMEPTAAPGIAFEPLLYPEPIIFGEGTPAQGYGYKDQVLLPLRATPSLELTGDRVTLKALVKWLACKTTCVPGQQEVTLTLPVGETKTPSSDAARFTAALAAVPTYNESPDGYRTFLSFPDPQAKLLNGAEFQFYAVLQAPADEKISPRADRSHPLFAPIFPADFELTKVEFLEAKRNAEITAVVHVVSYLDPPFSIELGGLFQIDAIKDGQTMPRAVGITVKVDVDAEGAPHAPAESIIPPPVLPLPTVQEPASGTVGQTGSTEETLSRLQALASGSDTKKKSIWWMVLLAFIGGIILNVMPCVLPVVSIKIFSLVNQSQLDRHELRRHGLAYTAGILVSFLTLATIVAVVKSGGSAFLWGDQYTSPLFIAILTSVVFVFSLSLFDLFIITLPTAAGLQNAGGKEGLSSSFFYGVFAMVFATPCTAPLLGSAVGFALSQSIGIIFLIFIIIALGLAFPFLLIAFIPAWKRFMPKPGTWMETFKIVMGFLLLGTVIWLLNTLGSQTGAPGLIRMMLFLLVLAFAAWIYGKYGNLARSPSSRILALLMALILAIGGGITLLRFQTVADDRPATAEADWNLEIPWQKWSEATTAELVAQGKTVFIDFTADWCANCKTYEKLVLETDEVRQAMHRLGVVPLKADNTRGDPEIQDFMMRHNRGGVPLYVVVGPRTGGQPFIIGDFITKKSVIEALEVAVEGSAPGT